MKIRKVETSIVEIPFSDGGKGEGLTPTTWRTLETVLVRVEDEDGVVGWGEGFGYFTADATKALVDRMITPVLIGRVVDDIAVWNLETQRRLHIFGRYGITLFAISGVDMALWDLKARREGVPLYRLLGGGAAQRIPFYASLVRYGNQIVAPAMCERALARGFTDLKLHEITLEDIEACRNAVGLDVVISVDVNCSWSEDYAVAMRAPLIDMGVAWLEEPIFPPEDFAALRRLRGDALPIAAGENWSTSVQFAAAFEARAVDRAQPSVTKVGGVTEFLKIGALAAHGGIELLPHCPYFGPGLFASMHLAAALPGVRQLEYLFIEPDAWLANLDNPGPGGTFTVPQGAGLGFEPDPDVFRRYRRA
jgi:L-alanine-DL-glutamate epimerase-like enolase superfamily enzyme